MTERAALRLPFLFITSLQFPFGSLLIIAGTKGAFENVAV